jgi:hypothetical protein
MDKNTKAVLHPSIRDAVKYVDASPEVIGQVPKHRLPIIDRNGVLKGHMGKLASEPTARRVGQLDGHARLQARGGRLCWIEQPRGRGRQEARGK